MNFTPSPRSYNFVKALEFALPWESGRPKKGASVVTFGTVVLPADGGLNYHDSGVATKWGIHQKSNPDLDVANLSLDDAVEVYKERYWLRYLHDLKPVYVNLDDAKTELAVSMFDGGVNCGVENMMIWFKRTLKEKDPTEVINEFRRAYYYQLVVKNKTLHGPNLNGWIRRLNDLEKYVHIIRASPQP
jgi:lysozyme family protein